ncbi:MAG: hypothetical protein ACTSWZ_07645 [Candidatus Heimdallarchaeaceae archaeon]
MTRLKVEAWGEYEKWEPRKVVDWIIACRRDEGIPMFKTKFARLPFKVGGEPATMAICWSGHDGVPSVMFTHVPKNDLKLIEEGFGDWRKILTKYGTKRDIEEAEKYGIYIKGFKLPKIVR